MKTDLPKVAVKLAGKPMILHVLDHLIEAGVKKIVLIVGHQKEMVMSLIPEYDGVTIAYAHQVEQLGTGHAALTAEQAFSSFQGNVIVASGDQPLISSKTFANLYETHKNEKNQATVLSTFMENPSGYGRLERDAARKLLRIVEEKDATEEVKKIKEVNTGTYVFRSPEIFSVLKEVKPVNKQGEFYLTDVISIIRNKGQEVNSFLIYNPDEAFGANSVEELQILEEKYRKLKG